MLSTTDITEFDYYALRDVYRSLSLVTTLAETHRKSNESPLFSTGEFASMMNVHLPMLRDVIDSIEDRAQQLEQVSPRMNAASWLAVISCIDAGKLNGATRSDITRRLQSEAELFPDMAAVLEAWMQLMQPRKGASHRRASV
jgi:2-phospho-L-lactate guanylyltransferase (CobY/MobA/RfbA family)